MISGSGGGGELLNVVVKRNVSVFGTETEGETAEAATPPSLSHQIQLQAVIVDTDTALR